MSAKKASQFTAEERKLYRQHFEAFDLNGDGAISARELGRASRHLGYRLTEQQIQDIMKEHDVDADGALSFEEFLTAMPGNVLVIKEDDHTKAILRRKFMVYDKDGNGRVTLAEAHDILKKELAFAPEQTAELIKRYDKNYDGQLSYEEFVGFFCQVQAKAKKIREMFNSFDKDGSGSVSVTEAIKSLRQYGIPDEEVKKMVDMYDTNKDGTLSFEEFVPFLLHL